VKKTQSFSVFCEGVGENVPPAAQGSTQPGFPAMAGSLGASYSGIVQDELGIWSSPAGDAKVAWFEDPDGNTLSISQH
jgi:hypothetical protein